MEMFLKSLTDLLRQEGWSVSVAESCTSGGVAKVLTTFSGASAYFAGGVVAYTNAIKIELLGVSEDMILKYTEVSAEVAQEMALGVCQLMHTSIGLSTTGWLGPSGGSQINPIGTVWLGLSIHGQTFARRLELEGERNEMREQAILELIKWSNSVLRSYTKVSDPI